MLVMAFTVSKAADIKTDVCVYGGSSAGVIAAYTAKMQGKKVILVEPGKHLGGLSSGGLGYTDIGNKYAVRGLGLDFYRRIGQHYGKLETWIFEPHVAEDVFKDYIKRAKVDVRFSHRLTSVQKADGAIRSIVVTGADGVTHTITAKMFIDCTYEGDLMAKAGVPYAVGREANSEYNEKYNGVQLMDGHQIPDGVDPYKTPGDASSGLLWGISPATLQPTGSGDKNVQAYNYRICLTTDSANRIPITQPENYDVSKYELLARLIEAQTNRRNLNDYLIISGMPNKKTDINNRNGFSTDMIGMNYNYPDGDDATRKAIIKQHEDYTKGLLYFLAFDPRVPASIQTAMRKYGYPKDEYTDNGHWSPQLYIREARRMKGAYVMRQANCTGEEVVPDAIGMAAYTMDSHNTQRIVVEKNGKKMVKNEGNVEVGGFPPYPIAYRSLIPQEQDCKNLLVPVCLSATHIAYGSIRMEPVFMCLAQAAALAACESIDKRIAVQQIEAAGIRAKMQKDPLSDGSTGDIFIDNTDAALVEHSGDWKLVKGKGSYGSNMLVNESGEGKARFKVNVPKNGNYTVYLYYPHVSNNADETKYTMGHDKQQITGVIRKADVRVEGQTSGEWVKTSVARFLKNGQSFVEISAEGKGAVIADAVLLIPAK